MSTGIEVRDPPQKWSERIRNWGPAFIVNAGVVGSGELILVPVYAATYGIELLWAVIFACWLRLWVTTEFARYSMWKNQVAAMTYADFPGPSYKGLSWFQWWQMTGQLYLITPFSASGIMASTAGLFYATFPQLPYFGWFLIFSAITLALLWRGYSRDLERYMTVMVMIFTAVSLFAGFILQFSPKWTITREEWIKAFTTIMPVGGTFAVVSMMGIVGWTFGEGTSYSTYAQETGYGKNFIRKPGEDEATWAVRCKGWIRHIQIECVFGQAVAFLATLSFFIMGASVLPKLGLIPSGLEVIWTFGRAYTEAFGPAVLGLYFIGAFFIIYSTAVTLPANTSRMMTYSLMRLDLIHPKNEADRLRVQRYWMILWVATPIIITYLLPTPVMLLQWTSFIGGIIGIIGSLMVIPITMKVPKEIGPSKITWFFLILTILIAAFLTVSGIIPTLGSLLGI